MATRILNVRVLKAQSKTDTLARRTSSDQVGSWVKPIN